MKILQVSHWYANVGGTESYITNLCRLLERTEHKTAIVYGHKDEATQSLHGVNGYFIPSIAMKLGRDEVALASFKKAIEREETDLVHFHLVNNPWLVERISTLLPTVYSIHNHFLTCPSGTRLYRTNNAVCDIDIGIKCLFNAYRRHCNTYDPGQLIHSYLRCLHNRRALGNIGKFLVHCKYMADTLIKAGFSPDRIEILPSLPGLPDRECSAKVPPDSIVLFVGRVSYEKGLQFLIQASRHINTKHKIVIAGDGWYLDKVKKLVAQLDFTNRVHFNSWTSKEKLHRLYQKASVVVVPSIYPEPFGLVGLEAMAHSRPVVAFRVGGISSWLKDGKNGFLAKPADFVSLGEKIDLLLRDRKLAKKMGAFGHQLLTKEYDPEKHLARLVETYESAIENFRERGKTRVFSC